MKITRKQTNDYFNENKESLYFSNIKKINSVSIYSIIGLILFSFIAFFTFELEKWTKLNIAYGIHFLGLIILILTTRYVMNKEIKNLAVTKACTYGAIIIIQIFIISISIFITSETIRPIFFLLINVLIPSMIFLTKKEMILAIIFPAIIFTILSYFFRNASFNDDLYIAISSIIFGIPFNLVFFKIKIEDAYVRTLYHKQANTDVLTSLPNKRAFDTKIAELLKEQVANSMLLAVLDLDKVKMINDTYGHIYGDKAIKGFAKILEICAVENDLFAYRIGGDEFAIIGIDYNINKAEEILNTVVTRVSRILIEDKIKVSVSIGGYFTTNITKYQYDEIFKIADEALYQVKENSRNNYSIISDL